MLGLAFSKTHEFLCFQTSQETRIISELSPFLISLGIERNASTKKKNEPQKVRVSGLSVVGLEDQGPNLPCKYTAN